MNDIRIFDSPEYEPPVFLKEKIAECNKGNK